MFRPRFVSGIQEFGQSEVCDLNAKISVQEHILLESKVSISNNACFRWRTHVGHHRPHLPNECLPCLGPLLASFSRVSINDEPKEEKTIHVLLFNLSMDYMFFRHCIRFLYMARRGRPFHLPLHAFL